VSIEEVQPRIYRISSTLGVRRFAQWLVAGDDRLLLVDTGVHGTAGNVIAPALAELGRQLADVDEVLISHADVDHYGGNAELRRLAPKARLRASAHDRDWLERWEVISRERYGWYRGQGLDYDESTWNWLRDAAGPDTTLDEAIEAGETLDLGAIELEVLGLPGHSPGHLGVWHPPSGTAIVIDAVLERGLYTTAGDLVGPPPYSSVESYRGTIGRLRDLAPERLGTSHYPPIEGRGEVTTFLDASERFVDDLDQCLRSELGPRPQRLEHFWRVADHALGPFAEMAVELARSVGAHLDLAVETGLAVRTEHQGLTTWRTAG